MRHDPERELLDREEALAREGVERALRGLGGDLIDALSLPAAWREHEMFEAGVSAAAGAITSEAAAKALAAAVVGGAARPGRLREVVRRACIDSALALARVGGTRDEG